MAKTCSSCHNAFNDDDAASCTICGMTFGDAAVPQGRSEPPSATGVTNEEYPGVHAQTFPRRQHDEPARLEASRAPAAATEGFRPGNVLEGRVGHIERNDEQPPANIFRFLSRFLIYMLFLVPFGILFISFGILALIVAILGFNALANIINPIPLTITIIEFMEVRALGGLRRGETVPVYRGILERRNGTEYAFMMRGPLIGGNFVVGQNVTLSGRWQQGTFIVTTGQIGTTGAAIVSSYRNPWPVVFYILFGLYVAGAVAAYMYWPQIEHSVPFDRVRW